ncbi:MAG: Lysophospholipase 1 [Piccolia ochrophora]|nr:MAG: Lysophospholipase 1 [Piccolia ochrophora]
MKDFLTRMGIGAFDVGGFFDTHRDNTSALPNIGLAFSGGGYRALMNGGGALKAFDDRTENSTSPGHLGGLLQSSTYIAGLSGGGWLVGSIFVNNFTTIADLQSEETGSVWEFGNSIFKGPEESGISILNTADYYKDIETAVGAKLLAGYNTSFTDYWGRALSYQLINASEGGSAYTWSSIARDEEFAQGNTPMPFIVADGRTPGEILISSNTTNYEFSPFEFGSFDPTVFGFAPLEFLGSAFTGGELPTNESCVKGFDNAGFVMGTSSSLFNQGLLLLSTADVPDAFETLRDRIVERFGPKNQDIAAYKPNPFYFWNNDTNEGSRSKTLELVDGGEDLQNIPLNPLIQPPRNVDVIFAVDSSADTEVAWPNGTALVATYERSLEDIQNGTAFPAIPDQNTFVNLGLNNRPTFFGCDSGNLTGPAPLIVYMPNAPYIYQSNVSTFTPETNNTERDAIIMNGYVGATLGNGTLDEQWPQCVGCAVLSRSFERTGTEVPQVCRECFERYCWDGELSSGAPPEYQPTFRLGEMKLSWGVGRSSWISVPLALMATIVVGLMIV